MKANHHFKKRVLSFTFIIALQLLYFPINQNVQGGINTALPIDARIPLSSIWAIPYLLSILWWIGSLIWAALKMDHRRWVRFSLSLSGAILISYFFYLLYPTYVVRPEIVDQGFLGDLMRFIYGSDRSYNALPSGHTYTTLLITMFWVSWHPKHRVLWMAIAVIVILSTLLTKQHAVLDLLSAAVLAFLCCKGSGLFFRKAPQPRST